MDLFNPDTIPEDVQIILAQPEDISYRELLDEAIAGIGKIGMILEEHKQAINALAINLKALEHQTMYLLSKDPVYVAAVEKLAQETVSE